MAYQNVGTPRFFVNVVEWLDSLGVISMNSAHFRTLPVNPLPFTSGTYPHHSIPDIMPTPETHPPPTL